MNGKKCARKPSLAIGAEHLLAEVFERALQVAERDVLVYHQAFALRELGKMRRIGDIATVHLARSNDVNRKILIFHNVNLNTGSLGAQQQQSDSPRTSTARPKSSQHIERILHGAAGMIGRGIQRREV